MRLVFVALLLAPGTVCDYINSSAFHVSIVYIGLIWFGELVADDITASIQR